MNENGFEFKVWNDKKLIIPELDILSEQKVKKDLTRDFIKNNFHKRHHFGIPINGMFDSCGFIIQPLCENTARITTVIEDEHALETLAIFMFGYKHNGLKLIIDEATVMITKEVLKEMEAMLKERESNNEMGIEFA